MNNALIGWATENTRGPITSEFFGPVSLMQAVPALRVTVPHTRLEDLYVNGVVSIEASNVEMKRCRFDAVYLAPDVENVYIRECTNVDEVFEAIQQS